MSQQVPEEPIESRSRRAARIGGQFIRFGVVGGSGVIVNMAVAVVINKLNGGSANATEILFSIPATSFNFRFSSLVWILSFLVANTYNYQLNRSWTFRGTQRAWWKGFWQFLAIGAVAAFIGMILKAMMMRLPVSSPCAGRGSVPTSTTAGPSCSRCSMRCTRVST